MNPAIVVFLFVVIVAIIAVSDNLTTAVMIMSLMANFLVICAQANKHHSRIVMKPGPKRRDPVAQEPPVRPPEPLELSNEESMYGPAYAAWQRHRVGYTDVYIPAQHHVGVSAAEATNNIDAMIAYSGSSRARDRKCIDGAVTKSTDYYRVHYAGELEHTENLPWWGRNEY